MAGNKRNSGDNLVICPNVVIVSNPKPTYA